MQPEDAAIFLGLAMILIHFFSDRLAKEGKRLLSFATGVSMTYIFLYLFPEVMDGSVPNAFLAVLLGFAVFHILEIHIYKHRSVNAIRKESKELHAVIFFMYHFLIGVVLLNIVTENLLGGILFFLPLLFHSTISSAAIPQLHTKIKGISTFRFFLSLSTLLGILVSMIIRVPEIVDKISFGFVTGALLCIVLRDALPKDGSSKPAYFISGVVLYYILITLAGVFSIAL